MQNQEMLIIANYCSKSNLYRKHSSKFHTFFLDSCFPETFHEKEWKKHIRNAEYNHYTWCFQIAAHTEAQPHFEPRKSPQPLQNIPTYITSQFLIFQIQVVC